MVIGIDLGTTTSAMSYYKNGKTEIIPNMQGKRMTDSVVALDRHGNIIVGEQAKRNIGKDKIEEVKRLMGSDRKVKLGKKEYLPEEISAEILKKLKKDAEDFLGEEINEAVITVPAMFTSSQKAATIKAGELAGFKVERIITEPTAAAMAYGISNMQEKQKILVYDFGGGTFDVSILELEEGILDVISTSGDNYLGGKDIDEVILRNLDIDIDQNNKQKLKLEIEEIKKRLSFNETVDIIIPEFEIDLEVTRNQFEKWIEPIIDKTIDFSKQALKNIKLVEDDIDIVLLVGGSTRIPLVQKKLKEIFREKVKKVGDPQEIVALGAGVQAAIKEDLISSETGLIVTDVCNYSLGVSCIGEYQGMLKSGVYSVIIPKLSSLPCLKSEVYHTAADNQESVNVEVYQGEEQLVENNIFLKSFKVNGIPKNKAGSESIKITFAYSINDILEVEVEILSTGEKKKISLEVNENKISEKKKNYKNSKYYSDYKVILDLAEEKIKKASENDRIKIRDIVQKMKEKLIEENIEELEKLDGILTDILFEV